MIDFYVNIPRQGPGSTSETMRALRKTGLTARKALNVADIGCGTGAQTFTLAENLDAKITAVDIFPEFLRILNKKAIHLGLQDRITIATASMDQLSFADNAFDLVWSEGAIYIMGFEEGIQSWRAFIKDKGYLVVSDISWFTESRPEELEAYWQKEYPQMDTLSNKGDIIEKHGYKLIDSFKIPESCWMDNYYIPIRRYLPEFLARHDNEDLAIKLADELEREIEMYEKYKDHYGYAFYVAQKIK
jgi:ubiquinone/menaquinone biosynthesis C-methylase UbiE